MMCDVVARQSRIDFNDLDSELHEESTVTTANTRFAEYQNGAQTEGQVFTIQTEEKLTSINGYSSCTDCCLEVPVIIDGPKLPQKEEQSDSSSESDFDPYEYGNEKNATSYWGTVMHMIIVGMSPTLLSLPYTFKQVGYVPGSVGSFCTVILYAYCMHMIVDGEYVLCKRLRRTKMSYTQVIYQAFHTGPKSIRWMASYSKNLIYAALISIWGGGNAIYVLLISQNIRSVLQYFYQYECNDRFIILWLVIPLVLLCWAPNLKLMVFYSSFSNTVNVCCILVISYMAAQGLLPLRDRKAFGELNKLPYFLGVVFVTVNGTGLLMSLKNQMRNPRKFRSRTGVLNVSYVTTGISYAFFGLICYLQYGDNIAENVILNLHNNLFTNMIKLLYALSVIFFYPLVSYVTFDIVWNDTLKKKFTKSSNQKIMKCVVQTCSALSSIVLAFLFPNMEIFVSITGTVCASLDSIIMPAIINMLVYSQENQWLPNVKNVLIIALGITFIFAGIADSFKALDKYYK